jgi:hypothetical protein
MVYADDVKPDRLVASRLQVEKFYRRLPGGVRAAIIPFSGMPNQYFCPPTKSKATFLKMLSMTDRSACPSNGTDLALAVSALADLLTKDSSGNNLVFVISDGGREDADSTDGGKLLRTVSALRTTAKCRFYAIGVGGDEPCRLARRDEDGKFVEFVLEGNSIATSKLDEAILRGVAEVGGGKYSRLSGTEDAAEFMKNSLEEASFSGGVLVEYGRKSVAWVFYAISAVLLSFSALVGAKVAY